MKQLHCCGNECRRSRLATPHAGKFALPHSAGEGLHKDLGLNSVSYHQGLFYDTPPAVLKGLNAPVDLAFIDGQHQYKPTLDFFDMIHQYSSPNALFIFDDVEWSDGMRNAWKKVEENSARVIMATSIAGVGFALTRREKATSVQPKRNSFLSNVFG
nr:class I SAM-dependent methyltransferase [Rhizobium sullae]